MQKHAGKVRKIPWHTFFLVLFSIRVFIVKAGAFEQKLNFTIFFSFFQGLTSSPPRDLNTLLIEIRIPDDIDKSPWAKQFREHLTSLNQPEKEAMFDFVLGRIFLWTWMTHQLIWLRLWVKLSHNNHYFVCFWHWYFVLQIVLT